MLTIKRHPKVSKNKIDMGNIMLATDAYLPWSGGSRVYYHNLYSRLASKYSCRVNVITSHIENDDLFDSQFLGTELVITRSGDRLVDWKYQRIPEFIKKYRHLSGQMRLRAPAVLHCGDLFPQALSGYFLRHKYKVPYLAYVHGDEISQTENRRLQPFVRNQIYRRANAIIAANRFAYDRVLRITESEKNLYLLTPGVDRQEFFPSTPAKEIVEKFKIQEGPVILTVARLVPRKGHEIVLRSLKPLLNKYPKLKYLIIGDGPGRLNLESVVNSLGMQNNIQFVGNVAHHELGDYYRAADVFIMANKEEPGGDIESFGMVFIEAGACGKPVIGGKSGGTDEAVLHGITGFLCSPDQQPEITQTIEMLLSNPELSKKIGRAGYQRAVNEFDWDSRAERLYEINCLLRGAAQ